MPPGMISHERFCAMLKRCPQWALHLFAGWALAAIVVAQAGDLVVAPQITQWQAPVKIADASIGVEVATDAKGRAIAVWSRRNSDNRLEILVAHSRSDGRWGDSIPLGHSEPRRDLQHAIAMNANGTAVVAWVQRGPMRDGVWAARYAPEGGWEAPVPITQIHDSVHDLQVAIAADGQAFVLWAQGESSYANPQSKTGLWLRRYISGQGWVDLERISGDEHSEGILQPRLAMNARGDAIIVWLKFDSQSSQSQPQLQAHAMLAMRYAPQTGWGEVLDIGSAAASVFDSTSMLFNHEDRFSLAMNERGDAIVVWTSAYRLWSNRYDAIDGWEGISDIHSKGRSPEMPSVAMDDMGRAVAIWTDGDRVFASGRLPGNEWDTPTVMAVGFLNRASRGADLGMDPQGNAVAVWIGRSQANQDAIWSAEYRVDTGWRAPMAVHVDAEGIPMSPSVATSDSRKTVVAWLSLTFAVGANQTWTSLSK
jgi:hypothetical protein